MLTCLFRLLCITVIILYKQRMICRLFLLWDLPFKLHRCYYSLIGGGSTCRLRIMPAGTTSGCKNTPNSSPLLSWFGKPGVVVFLFLSFFWNQTNILVATKQKLKGEWKHSTYIHQVSKGTTPNHWSCCFVPAGCLPQYLLYGILILVVVRKWINAVLSKTVSHFCDLVGQSTVDITGNDGGGGGLHCI